MHDNGNDDDDDDNGIYIISGGWVVAKQRSHVLISF